jgi:hypothetical protein
MESGFDTYMNSGYNFDRIKKKTMLVRWVTANASETKINLDLVEPFRLDVHSDIYLDNFTTFVSQKPSASDNSKTAFVLRINEFNIQSNVAGNASGATLPDNRGHMFNNIVIPADSFYNGSGVSSHKSKKMNYICSINPTTITKITGTVTDLDGSSMFQNASDSFVAEFVFIARD